MVVFYSKHNVFIFDEVLYLYNHKLLRILKKIKCKFPNYISIGTVDIIV